MEKLQLAEQKSKWQQFRIGLDVAGCVAGAVTVAVP